MYRPGMPVPFLEIEDPNRCPRGDKSPIFTSIMRIEKYVNHKYDSLGNMRSIT